MVHFRKSYFNINSPLIKSNVYFSKDLKFNRSTTLMHFLFANSFYVIQKQETVMSLINLVCELNIYKFLFYGVLDRPGSR